MYFFVFFENLSNNAEKEGSKRMNYIVMLNAFHNYVKHHDIPAPAQLIYLHMLMRDNELLWDEWFVFSVRSIMAITGIGSPNTVRSSIEFLQKAGMIEITKRNRAATQFKICPSQNFKAIPSKLNEPRNEKNNYINNDTDEQSVSPKIQIESDSESEKANCNDMDTGKQTVSDMIQSPDNNCVHNDTDSKSVSPSVSPSVSNTIQRPVSYNNINANGKDKPVTNQPTSYNCSSCNDTVGTNYNVTRVNARAIEENSKPDDFIPDDTSLHTDSPVTEEKPSMVGWMDGSKKTSTQEDDTDTLFQKFMKEYPRHVKKQEPAKAVFRELILTYGVDPYDLIEAAIRFTRKVIEEKTIERWITVPQNFLADLMWIKYIAPTWKNCPVCHGTGYYEDGQGMVICKCTTRYSEIPQLDNHMR